MVRQQPTSESRSVSVARFSCVAASPLWNIIPTVLSTCDDLCRRVGSSGKHTQVFVRGFGRVSDPAIFCFSLPHGDPTVGRETFCPQSSAFVCPLRFSALPTHVELARPKSPKHRVLVPSSTDDAVVFHVCVPLHYPQSRRATDSTSLRLQPPQRPATFMSPDRPGSLRSEWFVNSPLASRGLCPLPVSRVLQLPPSGTSYRRFCPRVTTCADA
jgi:hypothetical protein